MAPQEVRSSSGPGPQQRRPTVDEVRIQPGGPGDPFTGAVREFPQLDERPHACIGNLGYVYLGYVELEEDGEEVERVEAVPCRRCLASPGESS
jgi:hypothetical protein